ncbi:hypothetical protein GHT06_011794 [Daphnia sinensis]|uniref:N-acetyltransferase domain-containing protein n=1 Tax=Daphnia sinensis TaxID=1820382 RepID=A0AAD5KUH7_9CRUS|nr:hypothetical protein GHT06_011794 [Daphnia sinensis]
MPRQRPSRSLHVITLFETIALSLFAVIRFQLLERVEDKFWFLVCPKMEQQLHPTPVDRVLTKATRKCLFRLLSFLDGPFPERYAIQSMILAALLTTDSKYHVYFIQRHASMMGKNEDYCLIIGAKLEHCSDFNPPIKKCWLLTAWTDDDDSLIKAYEAIDVIDWERDAVVMHYKLHTPPRAISNFLIEKQGSDGVSFSAIDQYVLPIKNALNLQIINVEGVYVKSLERCHAQLVYDNWPYNKRTTVDDIAGEIDQLPSSGVFLKEDNQLVSWMMCHPPNAMSRLHTLEDHRRQGYAALVTRYLAKRLAQSGFVPFVNIIVENSASKKVFESLGFQFLRHIHIGDIGLKKVQ